MNQKFGVGDLAVLDGRWNVRITYCFRDEDDSIWYGVTPVDFTVPCRFATREVRQESLKAI